MSGAILVNGRNLGPNEVVFISKGDRMVHELFERWSACLRVELPGNGIATDESGYGAKVWRGPLTDDETPDLESR